MNVLWERQIRGGTAAAAADCLHRLADQRFDSANSLYHRDCVAHYGCVNAVEFSPSGKFLVSGGDDRRVLLWNVARTVSLGGEGGGDGATRTMTSCHLSNIFSLAFDRDERRVVSVGNDRMAIVHDIESGKSVDVFTEEQAIYCVSTHPCDSNLFVTACDNSRVLLFDLRQPLSDPHVVVGGESLLASFYSASFNVGEPQLIGTAHGRAGAAIYDIRYSSRALMSFDASRYGAMSARFSADGTRLFVLRRRLPPALYDIRWSTPLCQFDHHRYYNSCTMKSGCFAGARDSYVLSGSDDFNIYCWRVPDITTDPAGSGSKPETKFISSASMVLRGHRSIPNQVRFCQRNALFASSGVEKHFKLWSVFPYPGFTGSLHTNSCSESFSSSRRIFQHGDYLDMVVDSNDMRLEDYSERSTEEDTRMLAFFDTLVQREIAGVTTETESSEGHVSARDEHTRNPVSSVPADGGNAGVDCYFASSPDTQSSNDNIISQMVSLKRRQLMGSSRFHRKHLRNSSRNRQTVEISSSSSSASSSSSSPETTSPERLAGGSWEEVGRRREPPGRRRFRKARYVWLPESDSANLTLSPTSSSANPPASNSLNEAERDRRASSSSSESERNESESESIRFRRRTTHHHYRNRSYRVRVRRPPSP